MGNNLTISIILCEACQTSMDLTWMIYEVLNMAQIKSLSRLMHLSHNYCNNFESSLGFQIFII